MRQALITSLLSEVAESYPDVNLQDLERRFVSILSTYYVERTGTEVAVMDPFPRAAREFLSSRAIEGKSKVTLKAYKNLLSRFFYDINLPFTQIDATAIKVWLYSLQKAGLRDTTVAGYRKILCGFYAWCYDNEKIEKNPMKKIGSIKCENRHKRALSNEELASVRDACQDLRERAMVEMLYSTGCRVREFVSIRRSDVDLEKRRITAHNWKSRREKIVYISDLCHHYLKRYMSESNGEYIFYHKGVGGLKPIDVRTTERIISRLGERAGLEKGRLHPHIFRHTLATNIVSNGGSLSDAQMVLDHARPETTLIYAEISKTHLQETHRRCIS